MWPVGDRYRMLPALAKRDLGVERVAEVLSPARSEATAILERGQRDGVFHLHLPPAVLSAGPCTSRAAGADQHRGADLLTDPSRTPAVTADESTRRVLVDAARAIAERLRLPGDPVFERLWQLVLDEEDLRGVMVSATASAGKLLVTSLREEMTARRPPFAHSPLPLEPQDVAVVFPGGAPSALYEPRNQAAARAVKAVLGLRGIDIAAALAEVDPAVLSDPLRSRLGEHFKELARTHGRKLTEAESRLVHEAAQQEERPAGPDPAEGIRVTKGAPRSDSSLASVLKR